MTGDERQKIIENLSQRREIADAAKALLNDKAFGHCWMQMRQDLFALLLAELGSGPRQDELCARLRAQDEMMVRIGKLIEGYQHDVAQQRARHAS